MAKEKALKWTRQTGKVPYENNSVKNRALQMAKKNSKTTKNSSDRRKPKSSQKQHLENTDMRHLCKAGSVERPWGILSLFTTRLQLCVKSPCHRLCQMDYPGKGYYDERNTRKC